jgi:hypothetical protein
MKMQRNYSRRTIFRYLPILLLLAPLTVQAQNKVVVIPLFGDDSKPLKNIITVAKANGNFSDPVAAVNSIQDASEGNPYLVVIGPGIYSLTQSLVMKQFVDIVGSGENITKLTAGVSGGGVQAGFPIVQGADNSGLSSLTIENRGGSMFSVGLQNIGASPRVRDVTILARGGANYTYGVWNRDDSSPTMKGLTITASDGTYCYGVANISSSPAMTNMTITASGGNSNFGVLNTNLSFPGMIEVSASASGGENSWGVYNEKSSPRMTRVEAYGSGGTSKSIGVYNASDSYSSPIMTKITAIGDGLGVGSEAIGVRLALGLEVITDMTAIGRGADMNIGVEVWSDITMTNVTANGSGGSESYGVKSYDSGVTIRRSTLEGDTKGFKNLVPNQMVGRRIDITQSTIINGLEGGWYHCVACDDGDASALGSTCSR